MSGTARGSIPLDSPSGPTAAIPGGFLGVERERRKWSKWSRSSKPGPRRKCFPLPSNHWASKDAHYAREEPVATAFALFGSPPERAK